MSSGFVRETSGIFPFSFRIVPVYVLFLLRGGGDEPDGRDGTDGQGAGGAYQQEVAVIRIIRIVNPLILLRSEANNPLND